MLRSDGQPSAGQAAWAREQYGAARHFTGV
jgi:hypothetical protein